ncbi:nicotinate-nucleotide--dimethylbenzimidazole phosphoribosyltransferase [Streptomyces sp. 8N114]|uniref:nicotinate-nucleotide--dimethylbenzimidazole phosphoribosyltransferase n=1 Tax=Streptomyces sp. 8N114 TaxID=3457419 RepID=UPI003FCF235C
MTDTGQIPGEGLPENAGGQQPEGQPGVPASGTYTFADPAGGVGDIQNVQNAAQATSAHAPNGHHDAQGPHLAQGPHDAPSHQEPHEEEDLLLMPSAQGAWNEQSTPGPGQPMPQPQPQPQPQSHPQAQPQPEASYGYGYDQHGQPHPAAGHQPPQGGQLTPEAPYGPEGTHAPGDAYGVNGYAQHGYGAQEAAYVQQAQGDPQPTAQAAQPEQPQPDAGPAPAPQSDAGAISAPQSDAGSASAQQPDAVAAGAPEPHETDGRDSGSIDVSAVRTPQQPHGAPASTQGAAAGNGARRPLHLGPPVPEQSGTVRPLSERAAAQSAPATPQAAPVQGAPAGRAAGAAPQPAVPSDGRLPAEQPQGAAPAEQQPGTGPQPTAPAVMDSQTGGPAAPGQQIAGPQPAHPEAPAQQPEAQPQPQPDPEQQAPAPAVEEPLPGPQLGQLPPDAWTGQPAPAPVEPAVSADPAVSAEQSITAEQPAPADADPAASVPMPEDGQAGGEPQLSPEPPGNAPEAVPAEGGQAPDEAPTMGGPIEVSATGEAVPQQAPAPENPVNDAVPGPRQEAQTGTLPTVPAQGGESRPEQGADAPPQSVAPPINEDAEQQHGTQPDSPVIPGQPTAPDSPDSPGTSSEAQPGEEPESMPMPEGAAPQAAPEAQPGTTEAKPPAPETAASAEAVPADASDNTEPEAAAPTSAPPDSATMELTGVAEAPEAAPQEPATPQGPDAPDAATAEDPAPAEAEPAPAEPAIPGTESAEETSAEEAAAPETSAEETAAPETAAPETSAPETSAPETSAPGGEAVDAAAPDAEVTAPAESPAPEDTESATATEPADGEAVDAETADGEAADGETAEGRAADVEADDDNEAATTEAPDAQSPDAQPAAAETPTGEAEAADAEPADAEPAEGEPAHAEGEPVGDAAAPADTPAGDPAAGYAEAEREAVHRLMRERRDIRNGFRRDPIPHDVLLRVLEAAHTAPSVGHSQPWDFVVIRSEETRRTMHELAERQRQAYAKSLPKGRAKQFKEMKIEAILDTPVNIVVTADPTRGGRHTLGRHTQPQMAPYSSALAVENLWLAARAEGLGVGWVSFFDERELVRTLELPEHLEVVAYLCVGYVDEFPDEPELMQAGWSKRRPLSWVVHEESYGRRALPGAEPTGMLAETLGTIRPLDAKALGEAWERQKRMTKPSGALGMLEIISAQLCGLSRKCPPPVPEPAAVAVFAGDHGVHAQGVTPWPQEVTAQMVANFLGGGAVCNAFANQVGAEVCVIDVGVAAELPTTPGLLPRKVRAGTADMTVGPALTREEVERALEVGIETARDLVAAGNKALLTGEMGIANTTASAALIAACTGADPAEVTGRGTGINDETHARKVEVVRRALELHQPDPADPLGMLSAFGGLEHAAMVGLILGGASLRTPVILDGVSAGAAALVARAVAPEALAACIAGHRSAEPGHVAALTKLGLRPLVDLDLRLGEGTGALLALPMVQSAARAMHEVATFDAAGVTEKG